MQPCSPFTIKTMKNFIFLSLIAILAGLGCNNNKSNDSNTGKARLTSLQNTEIPRLLDRREALRNGKEWDNVQNIYGACKKALMENPKDWDSRLKLAELFIQEARVSGEHPHYYPAALEVLAPAVDQLSQIAQRNAHEQDFLFRALSYKASVQLSLHDFENALLTAQDAVAINPYNAQIYGALVDAHVELGNYAKAVEMADKMVEIRPDLRSYSRISYLREIYGDVPGAMEALDMAIKAGYPGQESTAWARQTLGNLYKTFGQYDKAAQQYNLILEERPDYPFAIGGLGAVAYQQKDYVTAIAKFRQACALMPELSFYEQLAQCYQKTQDKAALDSLLPQIDRMMQEDMAKGHNLNLEMASYYTDVVPNLPKALACAQAEYARRPDNIDVNRAMAKIYLAMGDKTGAQKFIQAAAATGSKHPDLLRMKRPLG